MAKIKRRPTSTDPVTEYALSVVSGATVAGPHVRDACRRHLEDLEQAPDRGFFFDLGKVERAIGFYRDVLRLNGGEFEGRPYELLGWQAFVVGSLLGWVDSEGYRRFRTAYIETAKGSGKSPLAAGLGIFGTVADNEARAEVYAAATKKDQAMILFRDAVAMVDQSPELGKRLKKSGVGQGVWNLAYLQTGSFFRPISADDGQSGPRPHFTLIDEVHEHKTPYVIEMMKAGFKFRKQPLMVMITNSGTDRRRVCWDYHSYGAKVCSGVLKDDSFFSYICALDEGDDPFKDETCWHKANPSLEHGIPGLKYLREQVHQARGMLSKEAVARRLNFCEWVESESPWIGGEPWRNCEPKEEFDKTLLLNRRCFGGLDLGSTQDLTAFVLLFEPTEQDPFWRLLPHFWLPGDGLHEKEQRDEAQYLVWQESGELITQPGRAINKLSVAHKVSQLAGLYDIQDIGFDRWRIEDFKVLVDTEGLSLPTLVPFGQGFKDMSPALEEFERMIINGTLRHDGNAVMTYCARNAVLDIDPAGNRKVAKDRGTGRVDGVVAAIMAAGRAAAAKPIIEPQITWL
jgi:phage terminase large subunit-like protein